MKAQYKEPVILRLKVKQIHFCCSLRKLKSQDQASIIAGTEMRKLYFRPLSSAPSWSWFQLLAATCRSSQSYSSNCESGAAQYHSCASLALTWQLRKLLPSFHPGEAESRDKVISILYNIYVNYTYIYIYLLYTMYVYCIQYNIYSIYTLESWFKCLKHLANPHKHTRTRASNDNWLRFARPVTRILACAIVQPTGYCHDLAGCIKAGLVRWLSSSLLMAAHTFTKRWRRTK